MGLGEFPRFIAFFDVVVPRSPGLHAPDRNLHPHGRPYSIRNAGSCSWAGNITGMRPSVKDVGCDTGHSHTLDGIFSWIGPALWVSTYHNLQPTNRSVQKFKNGVRSSAVYRRAGISSHARFFERIHFCICIYVYQDHLVHRAWWYNGLHKIYLVWS